MAIFKVKSPDGRTVTLQGETQPTEAELDNIFKNLPASASSSPERQANVRLQAPQPQLKSIFPKVGVEAGGSSPYDIALSGMQGTAKDVTSIPAAFFNQFLYNHPRAITEKAGFKYPAPKLFEDENLPDNEVTSPAAGWASKVSGATGMGMSPLNKIALIKSLKGGNVASKAYNAAIAGALYSPDDPTDILQRGVQAGTSAVVAPPLEYAAVGAAKNIPKLIRGLADVRSKSVKAIRSIGAKNVFKTNLDQPDYVTRELRPQVERMAKAEAVNMNPKTLKELGLQQDTIDFIGKMTPEEINQARYSDGLGEIIGGAKSALQKKIDVAKQAYHDVIKKIPMSRRMQPTEYRKGLTEALEGMFASNKKGFRKDLQPSTTHSRKPYMALYKELTKQLKAAKNGQGFDKTQYVLLHDHLINLQQSPDGYISAQATKLKALLEADAQKFGFGDIAGVKEGFKQAKEHEPFMAKQWSSKKIARELSPEDQAALQKLEAYIEKKIIEPAQKVNAVTELDDLVKSTFANKTELGKKTESILNRAQRESLYTGNEKNLGQAAEELTRFMGSKEKAIAALKNLTSNRLAQETSSKGFYSSRAGTVKGIARSLLRAYEEKIRPGVSDKVSGVKNANVFGQNLKEYFKSDVPSLKKKLNDKGYVILSTNHPDLYKFDPLKPAAVSRDGKIVEKFVYDPKSNSITPVGAGEMHASVMQKAQKENRYEELVRGINKGNITILRPSMSQSEIVKATFGDVGAWNRIRDHQVQVARKLFRNDPGRKVILASGGYNGELPFYDDASQIPANADKLANPRFVYTVPKLTPAERNAGTAFTRAIDPEIGGVTINLYNGVQPSKGYAVAVAKKYEFKVAKKDFDPSHIDDYFTEHEAVIAKKGNYLGIWEDNGIIYMDITTVVPDKQLAFRLGTQRNQLGVYGFVEKQTFRLDELNAKNITGKNKGTGKAGGSPANAGQAVREKATGLKEKVKEVSTST